MAAGVLLLWQKVRRFFVQRSAVDWEIHVDTRPGYARWNG